MKYYFIEKFIKIERIFIIKISVYLEINVYENRERIKKNTFN